MRRLFKIWLVTGGVIYIFGDNNIRVPSSAVPSISTNLTFVILEITYD